MTEAASQAAPPNSQPTTPARLGSIPWAAIAALCGGVFVFSSQDVIIKFLSGAYPVHEVVLIRCITALPILCVMVHLQVGLKAIISGPILGLLLRGLFLVVSYSTYYLAFPVMKLADIVALFFTVPIFVTALAGPMLGEIIGWRRWGATLIGFAGVLIMLRPGSGVFNPAALLPVIAAAAYALAQLMARNLAAKTPALVMSFWQNLMYLVASGIAALCLGHGIDHEAGGVLDFLLRPWVMPSWRDLALLAACGPIAAIGMTLLSQAYRAAEANFVTSFEYSGLIWATLWGFFVFGEVPDAIMFLGAALIVGAGLYMLFSARSNR